MPLKLSVLVGALATTLIALPHEALAGAWKFNADDIRLSYDEGGKSMFSLRCGRSFILAAKYPGVAGKEESQTTVTLSTPKAKIVLKGEFVSPSADGAETFASRDLGYARSDPKLGGKEWKAQQAKLLDLLQSGDLTLSAGTSSYQIPSVNAAAWRPAFNDCG